MVNHIITKDCSAAVAFKIEIAIANVRLKEELNATVGANSALEFRINGSNIFVLDVEKAANPSFIVF
jgi:hypothetical protein